MVLISFIEILYILVATLVVGYIFTGLFKIKTSKDVLDVYTGGFDWKEFRFACLVAAPGIILHEMAHKFVAMGFGLTAQFYISPFGLAIGIVLKFLGTGFMILAPGYVMISGASGIQSMITALSGPLINLALWGLAFCFLKYKTNIPRNSAIFWTLTSHINKWLFVFNILPIPPLDGAKVWIPLFQMIF